MIKKVNKRQIRHLIRALIQSKYYLEKMGENFRIDLKFVEAIQLFFIDSKGKNVERVINAFRTVSQDFFGDIPKTNFVEAKMKLCVFEFLMKNMEAKNYNAARRLIFCDFKFDTEKIYEIHPQKIEKVCLEYPLYSEEWEKNSFKEKRKEA